MKRNYLFLVLLLAATLCSSAHAQYKYKPFRVDLGQGYALPTYDFDANFGITIYNVEPKYTFADRFTVGLRWEVNWMNSFKYTQVYEEELQTHITVEERSLSFALTPTFDYHFTTGTFRPFVGAGIGVYFVEGSKIREKDFYLQGDYMAHTESGVYPSDINPGFMLRAGFDVTHFRFAIAYNYAGPSAYGIHHNYVAFTAIGYIGGGKIHQIYSGGKLQ